MTSNGRSLAACVSHRRAAPSGTSSCRQTAARRPSSPDGRRRRCRRCRTSGPTQTQRKRQRAAAGRSRRRRQGRRTVCRIGQLRPRRRWPLLLRLWRCCWPCPWRSCCPVWCCRRRGSGGGWAARSRCPTWCACPPAWDGGCQPAVGLHPITNAMEKGRLHQVTCMYVVLAAGGTVGSTDSARTLCFWDPTLCGARGVGWACSQEHWVGVAATTSTHTCVVCPSILLRMGMRACMQVVAACACAARRRWPGA